MCPRFVGCVLLANLAVVGACGGDDAADADADADAEMTDTAEVDAPTLATTCLAPDGAVTAGTERLVDALGEAAVTIDDRAACYREYVLSSTAELRDGLPANPRTIVEVDGQPTVRTGHDLFDALHALAVEEVRQNAVDTIRNGAFDRGQPVDCGPGGCFETGRKWNYVWTRDTAYAVDLGLAAEALTRARNSLLFKVSGRRGGGSPEIVQDTGSGGSWPVSTDRVTWAFGAAALLDQLDGAAREAFAATALEALRNTVERDRRVAWNPVTGLYRGEQSFLDWREQSYPLWTRDDVAPIAMSEAVGTNVAHLAALRLAARLASEAGDSPAADRWAGWAAALRAAIRERLWDDDAGLFAAFTLGPLDPAPAGRYDLLGNALAVLHGVADPEEARRILASYPHYGPATAVVWPQQPLMAIYHNRGAWPFVTAYWLRAARVAANDAVGERMIRALISGAALNLSNMENLHAANGAPADETGDGVSGPVVNSQRQLWSVAGYLSMVRHTIFGLRPGPDGLAVRPWLPRRLRDGPFAGTDALVLNDAPYRGRRVSVVLHLPPAGDGAAGGSYTAASLRLNDEPLSGALVSPDALGASNRIDVTMALDADAPAASLTETPAATGSAILSPFAVFLTGLGPDAEGRLALDLFLGGDDDPATAVIDIYRDGEIVAADLPGDTTRWVDPDSDVSAEAWPCYTAEASFVDSGHRTHRARPRCWHGPDGQAVTRITADAFEAVGGTAVTEHGWLHYADWGAPGDSLTAAGLTVPRGGPHRIQLLYANGSGPVDTGITCAVKRLTVVDEGTGDVVADAAVVMPQLGRWSRWELSTLVPVTLEVGRSYRVVIASDPQMVNMSAFEHFAIYTGGAGGVDGPVNRVHIAELRVIPR